MHQITLSHTPMRSAAKIYTQHSVKGEPTLHGMARLATLGPQLLRRQGNTINSIQKAHNLIKTKFKKINDHRRVMKLENEQGVL